MSTQKEYIEQNKQRFLDELFSLLRIPSVSADPKYKNDVLKTADAVKASLIDTLLALKLPVGVADRVQVVRLISLQCSRGWLTKKKGAPNRIRM